ncbi:MAG: DEAD/DEAH box helicase [Pseudomonadota bacterium]
MKPDTKSYSEPVGAALWLGAESPLGGVLPGFAPRPGQLELAQAVERCYRQQLPLIAEAGTGTGKTLAYLVPAVLSGLKTVVSTGTRTLQDQVSGKELPLLKAALAPELRWAVLKGRANYLCLRRYEDFARQPDLGLPGAPGALALLRDWAKRTTDGDLDQVRGQAVAPAVLAEVTANAEQCLAGRCPRRDECWLMEARRRAAEAEIVVVNHHLFLADLALKAAGHGEALPRYQAVIFDEAHLVAEVATQVFGVSVSSHRLLSLIKDVLREAPAASSEAILACRQAGDAFFAAASRLAGPSGSAALGPEQIKRLAPAGRALAEALEALAAALGAGDAAEALASRAVAIGLDLTAVAQPVAGQSVAWAALKGRAVEVNLSPVEVAPHLQHALYDNLGRLVFTSATLAAMGDLEPARQRLGLPSETLKLSLTSPFDQARQALLYVPRKMPLPPGGRVPGRGGRPGGADHQPQPGPGLCALHHPPQPGDGQPAPCPAPALRLPGAGPGPAHGAAAPLRGREPQRALRHRQLLAGGGRARPGALGGDCGQTALCPARRPPPGRARGPAGGRGPVQLRAPHPARGHPEPQAGPGPAAAHPGGPRRAGGLGRAPGHQGLWPPVPEGPGSGAGHPRPGRPGPLLRRWRGAAGRLAS